MTPRFTRSGFRHGRLMLTLRRFYAARRHVAATMRRYAAAAEAILTPDGEEVASRCFYAI